MEFHVSREARGRYRFKDSLFSPRGTIVFDTPHAARLLADKINRARDLARRPEQAVKAGPVNALGLIEEILRYVIGLYRETKNPRFPHKAIEWLRRSIGPEQLEAAQGRFVDEFPPPDVHRKQTAPGAYLDGQTEGAPNRHVVQDEMLMIWLANQNPAYAPFLDLFDDAGLEGASAYPGIVARLGEFFKKEPCFGPDDQDLVAMLRSPAIASPDSLFGQLEYIWTKWGYLLGRYEYLFKLLRALDVIREEENLRFVGPGIAQVYDFTGLGAEAERFSADRDWMPRCVLIAKNTHVWLDQLSRKYKRSISRLDQIPDEELDLLSRRGFSGLWLIGLWERSRASQRIKQLRGNQDAVASAYSLFEYSIAEDLGGEKACLHLKERAWARGIRLASDMVPNHMGIDSRWVIENPDWFLSLDRSPFPSYTFGGSNLSGDERVGIYIEDHYFDGSDAAVVFKRVDHWTGGEKYVYHGNDGTSMPWNDTAQLDHMKPEVREAIIQAIIGVAKRFPILRFDAAMTLAKRHYQRLWFPPPGSGGAIPSRAEHGLTGEQFNARMPEEFWREVVDRVAQEVPDTLLLAEAFWMMEGYFVRTLGMHRVYNSAFMNMLRDEDNANYRTVIKKTLEFDPEILKRYVNFMNNPDEKTAVEQFGKGDKYFGICTVMATLPGLPMFGHGQVEGFSEKYGMEFRRPLWDETDDPELVARHEREIFPLLHRRRLFAEVQEFLLYDFFTPDGRVNEDVFAYSNRAGEERALVVYLNRFASAGGWVRISTAQAAQAAQVPQVQKTGGGGNRRLVQKSLGEGLGLAADGDGYAIFRDQLTGLEYLRSSHELHEKGMYLELGAYGRHVFLDFREVRDDARKRYAQLARDLGGRGVRSIEEAFRELFLRPVHELFKELVSPEMFHRLMAVRVTKPGAAFDEELLDEIESRATRLLREIKQYAGGDGNEAKIAREIRKKLAALLQMPVLDARFPSSGSPRYRAASESLRGDLAEDHSVWGGLFGWVFLHALGKVAGRPGFEALSRSFIDELLLGPILAGTLQALGPGIGSAGETPADGASADGASADKASAGRAVALVRILTEHQPWLEERLPTRATSRRMLQALVMDEEVRRYLGVNRYDGVVWFNKEAFDELLKWSMILAAVGIVVGPSGTRARVPTSIVAWHGSVLRIGQLAEESGYQLEKLLALVGRVGRVARVTRVTKPARTAGSTKPRKPRAVRAR